MGAIQVGTVPESRPCRPDGREIGRHSAGIAPMHCLRHGEKKKTPPTPNKVDRQTLRHRSDQPLQFQRHRQHHRRQRRLQTDHNHDDCYSHQEAETYNKAETVTTFTNKAEVAAAPATAIWWLAATCSGQRHTRCANKSFGNISTARLGTWFLPDHASRIRPRCAPAPLPFLTATLVGVPGFALANASTNTEIAPQAARPCSSGPQA